VTTRSTARISLFRAITRGTALALALAPALALSAACSAPERTAITLLFDSNIGDELARLRIYTGGFGVMPGEPNIDLRRSATVTVLTPGSLTLHATMPASTTEDLFVWARGELTDGRTVTTRAQIRFQAGQTRVESMFLARECVDPSAQARCSAAGLTCDEGARCVPVSRDGASPMTDAGPPLDVVTPPADAVAPPTDAPVTEVVECPMERISCGGACVDPRSDALHCGRCGQPCRADQQCLNGGCACAVGRANCGGSYCAVLSTDPNNCGSCGHACPATQRCVSGACQ